MNDPVSHYRKNSLELMMTLSKKLKFFRKEPLVLVLVNKIGDTDKMISSLVIKFIAICVKHVPDLGRVIIEVVGNMLSRSNLPEDTRLNLITCLSNLNFEDGGDQHIIALCNEVFM